MLIRSQNKKQLIDITWCTINVNIENEIGIWGNNSSNEDPALTLGYYQTEEKAIKVLDMIQAAYQCSLYSDHAFDDSAKVQRPYIFVENKVFQMPSDEELEV